MNLVRFHRDPAHLVYGYVKRVGCDGCLRCSAGIIEICSRVVVDDNPRQYTGVDRDGEGDGAINLPGQQRPKIPGNDAAALRPTAANAAGDQRGVGRDGIGDHQVGGIAGPGVAVGQRVGDGIAGYGCSDVGALAEGDGWGEDGEPVNRISAVHGAGRIDRRQRCVRSRRVRVLDVHEADVLCGTGTQSEKDGRPRGVGAQRKKRPRSALQSCRAIDGRRLTFVERQCVGRRNDLYKIVECQVAGDLLV